MNKLTRLTFTSAIALLTLTKENHIMNNAGHILAAAITAAFATALCIAADNQDTAKPAVSEVALVEKGQAMAVIVLAPNASVSERTAANELAVYLQRLTGAEFAVVKPADAAGKSMIAVGPGAAKAVAPNMDLAKEGNNGLGEDGIVLKTAPPHLVLTGAEGAKRGTLYAVYEFLERVGGVRWWTPTEEFVPSKLDLSVPALETRYTPPFLYRETLCGAIRPFVWEHTAEVPQFAVRMRQNGHFPKIPDAWGGHYTLIGWCHTFFGHEGLMPPEKYFKDHPDWYSEINGNRKWEQAQLCMTNEAMLAELTRNVLERIRKNPDAGMISVAQNDWAGNCQCAACKAMDDAEGSPAGSLLHGINRVAEGVEKEFPGFYIETLAYQYTRKPPKTIRPRRNVIVRLAVIERSAVQPIESDVNRPLREDIEAWSKVATNLYIWDYTANLNHPFTPEPRASTFGPDLRLYKRRGAISVFCEHSHGSSPISDFDQLHTWLLSKLLWNPDQDDLALRREFLDGYYGAAGEAIGRYLNLLTEKVGNRRISSWSGDPDAEWMDLETMNQATRLFDAAAKAVAADSVLTARVQRARLSLDAQWLRGYAGYKFIAERNRTPFLGPTDLTTALSRFGQRCHGLGVLTLGYGNAQPLAAYLDSLRLTGQTPAPRVLLATDKTYQAFLAGARVPLPPRLARLPPEAVVDVHENRMSLFEGARLALDPKASNAAAAQIDPAVYNWSVQVRELAAKGVTGRWHAYAMVRVEPLAETGVAFQGGVYDGRAGKGLMGISQRLEDKTGSTPGENIRDGEYHLYDFGAHDFDDDVYVWISPVGGAGPRNVKAIYVDRFVFVRET